MTLCLGCSWPAASEALSAPLEPRMAGDHDPHPLIPSLPHTLCRGPWSLLFSAWVSASCFSTRSCSLRSRSSCS